MPSAPQPAADPGHQARDLLAGRFEAVLSTLADDPAEQPFGSVVPYCLDRAGRPLLLLSHLAQHSRHLQTHARCSLTVLAAGGGDVQQRARLTGVGLALPVSRAAGERYLQYFPRGRMYLEELNFRYYRFEPERFHFNAGFATARWLGRDRVMRDNPLSADQEAAVLGHMNTDHRDTLRGYLRRLGVVAADPASVSMAGIDAEGLDLRVDDDLYRIPLPAPVSDPDTARDALLTLARVNTPATTG